MTVSKSAINQTTIDTFWMIFVTEIVSMIVHFTIQEAAKQAAIKWARVTTTTTDFEPKYQITPSIHYLMNVAMFKNSSPVHGTQAPLWPPVCLLLSVIYPEEARKLGKSIYFRWFGVNYKEIAAWSTSPGNSIFEFQWSAKLPYRWV